MACRDDGRAWGDWIECDGIRGKVESVGPYQSTQVLTNDGCIIASQ